MTLYLTKKESILGWIYMAMAFLVLPVVIAVVGLMLGFVDEAGLNLILYVLNAVCCGWIFRRLLKQSWENLRGRQNAFINAVVLGFIGYYAAATAVGLLVMYLKPDFANVNDQNITAMIARQPLLIPAITVLVPLAEECLFRGLIFVPLYRKHKAMAYVVTCLSFAAIHVVGYIGSYDALTLMLCFVQYLAPGIALCWACQKADSLLAPIAIHALINTLSVVMM